MSTWDVWVICYLSVISSFLNREQRFIAIVRDSRLILDLSLVKILVQIRNVSGNCSLRKKSRIHTRNCLCGFFRFVLQMFKFFVHLDILYSTLLLWIINLSDNIRRTSACMSHRFQFCIHLHSSVLSFLQLCQHFKFQSFKFFYFIHVLICPWFFSFNL